MFRSAHFTIALTRNADAAAFKDHVRNVLFPDMQIMAPTRVTRGFSHRLLEVVDGLDGLPPRFVWEATADLMGNGAYDFARNAVNVQAGIAAFGVLVDLVETVETDPA